MCQEYCLSDSILFVFFLAEMVNRLRKCEFCGQTFTNRSAYNRHKTKMHAKRFCRWCNHEEDRPYLLRDHIRRHHPHVNVNTTAEVLYRSADVPVERELFPTPARYSPYTPEEVEMPLTYIPTPKVAGTSFQPIAPRPQQTSTPVLLPLAVNSMAASSQQPPARKRTLERPRTVVVAHCHAKVGKQDPDKLEDCTAVSQLSPVSDWADDENGIVLEEPPKITVEQYLKRQKKMESSDADEPESDLANGLKPDALWYDMQASIRHVLETTEQKSAEEVWKEVAVAKRGPSSALGSQASSTVTSEEDLEEMMSMDGPQLTASEPEQPRPDPSLPDDPEALQKDDGEQGVFTRLHLSSITTTPCPVMTCPDGDVSSPGPQHIGTPLGELQNEVLDLSIASPTHVPVADASKANDKVVLPAVGTGEEPQSDAWIWVFVVPQPLHQWLQMRNCRIQRPCAPVSHLQLEKFQSGACESKTAQTSTFLKPGAIWWGQWPTSRLRHLIGMVIGVGKVTLPCSSWVHHPSSLHMRRVASYSDFVIGRSCAKDIKASDIGI